MNLQWLFPYRSHLEAEVEYLKEQLAQEKRHVIELEDKLVQIANPPARVVYKQSPDGKLTPAHPVGIEAVRAYRRSNPPAEPEAVPGPFKTEETANAV